MCSFSKESDRKAIALISGSQFLAAHGPLRQTLELPCTTCNPPLKIKKPFNLVAHGDVHSKTLEMPAARGPFSALSGGPWGSILPSECFSTNYQKGWKVDPPAAATSASVENRG